MSKVSVSIRRLAASALFLSIALVLKTFFSIHIPLFGQGGMSVGVSGIFSMMPSLLFGPWYGAAVSALSDLLGYLLKPTGAYMPLLTLSAALGGFLRGAAFMALRRRSDRTLRIVVTMVTVVLLLTGSANILALNHDGVDNTYYERVSPEEAPADVEDMQIISRLVVTRTMNTKNPSGNLEGYITTVTNGPLGCGALGLIFLLVDLLASRKFVPGKTRVGVLAMMLAVMGSGLVVTTLNTVILRETVYASWKVLPFFVLWVPRVVEEILMGSAKVCFTAMLMGVFVSHPALKAMVHSKG